MTTTETNVLDRYLESTTPDRVVDRFLATRKTAKIDLGETVEQGNVRIHRYRPSLVVWDLTNAGKRGAKVERLTILTARPMPYTEEERFIGNIAMMIDGLGSMGRIVGTLNDYLRDYPNDLRMETSYERGVDVMPAGFKVLKIQTDQLELEVGHKEFVVRDKKDTNNEPTCIPTSKGGLAGIPAFYRWVRDNEASIRHMSFQDMMEQMSKLGVRYHYYCAMD